MIPPIDILVHISGPSLGRDDARYRAQAKGYMEFEPVERHALCEVQSHEAGHGEESLDNGCMIQRSEELEQHHSRETDSVANNQRKDLSHSGHRESCAGKQKQAKIDVGDEGNRLKAQTIGTTYLNSEESHIGGQQDEDAVRKSPSKSTLGTKRQSDGRDKLSKLQEEFQKKFPYSHIPAGQSSTFHDRWHEAFDQPGVLADTPLSRKLNASLRSPFSGVKETPHLHIAQTPALPRPRTAPDAAPKLPDQVPILRRTQSDSWRTPPSTIPDSQPNNQTNGSLEISSSPCLKRPFLSSSPSPKRNSPPGTKRPRVQVPSSPPPMENQEAENPAHLPSEPSSPPPYHPPSSPPLQQIPSSPPEPQPSSSIEDFLQIHPPQPAPANGRFTTHMTPDLIRLSTSLPLARGFTPFITIQTRPFEKTERGHWLIPLSSWDAEIKTQFWNFLKLHIQGGHVGFGVRAFGETVEMRDGMEVERGLGERREEVAKVYCWGEVVGEVWLLLFVGSKKAVRGVGTRWVDAGGRLVLTMK